MWSHPHLRRYLLFTISVIAPPPPPPQVASTKAKAHKPIAAVLVFSEPKDWHASLQILLDVLTSVDGEPVEARGGGPSSEQAVKLIFSNPDVSYPASHSVPRLTQGAFRICLEALYHRATGRRLVSTCCGKPMPTVFECARQSLGAQSGNGSPFDAIYMIGDNPRSDIKGANAMGVPWVSVLVKTGAVSCNDAENPADFVCEGAQAAVDMIFKRHGIVPKVV